MLCLNDYIQCVFYLNDYIQCVFYLNDYIQCVFYNSFIIFLYKSVYSKLILHKGVM